jgi:hypothetical protein
MDQIGDKTNKCRFADDDFQLLLDSELCLYALSVGSNNIDDQAAEMLMTFLAAHKSEPYG